MPIAISKDGTAIAYEKTGKGPGIVLVNGALAYRKFYGERELANRLAKNFTVIFYDRRGRGESTDKKPYAVEKEIEDIEALIDEAGGSAYLYGVSSGASLALLAAKKLGPEKVIKLALYEPPYGFDGADGKQEFAREKKKINELVAADKPGDAVTVFMESTGMPSDKMEDIKKSPDWKNMERVGHTLVYDFEVLGDGTVPLDIAKRIAVPSLVIDGEKSFDFIHRSADTLAKIIPGAMRKTLKGQTHEVSPEALAPVLMDFFV
jgi:pimeloyl-ACP methyl ester carboxylesterase